MGKSKPGTFLKPPKSGHTPFLGVNEHFFKVGTSPYRPEDQLQDRKTYAAYVAMISSVCYTQYESQLNLELSNNHLSLE